MQRGSQHLNFALTSLLSCLLSFRTVKHFSSASLCSFDLRRVCCTSKQNINGKTRRSEVPNPQESAPQKPLQREVRKMLQGSQHGKKVGEHVQSQCFQHLKITAALHTSQSGAGSTCSLCLVKCGDCGDTGSEGDALSISLAPCPSDSGLVVIVISFLHPPFC